MTMSAVFFLLSFWQKEQLYTNKMGALTSNSDTIWLSCDHTFASVSNVGSIRPEDGKWITQYNGLFCVLNPEGQVLTWKLTRSLSFDHIKEQLERLNERFHQNEKVVHEFFIDICCSWRHKLQQIFGTQLKVYLDLFHAVQRIGRKLPKRHPFHSACMRSLTLVFRDPTDMETPSPDIIRHNLEEF